MNVSPIPCDDSQLLDLVYDRLDNACMETVLDHIESCARCRRRMENLSAARHHWQKTVQVLSDSQNDPWAPTASHASLSEGVRSSDALGSEVLVKPLLSPPSHPEMLGRLGRYEVERLIGKGGMGVVFKAFDTELNRPVAIKVLLPHLASHGSSRQRFSREARAAAAVVNEHVVPIHNVETEGETPFLVMQYVDGESLQAKLDRDGPLEIDQILRIGMQAAAGLAAAHQQGLVHRDIKPANILLESGLDRALITDFGLAQAIDDVSLTYSGHYVGTPQYMSPEQAGGDRVDHRSDLFSLGSVLYAMCAGRPPFRADRFLGLVKRIIEDQPRSIQEVNPRLPDWLNCIIARLLVKDPGQRISTAEEVRSILAQCLAHVQEPTARELPPVVQAWLLESRQREGSHATIVSGTNANRLLLGLRTWQAWAVATVGITAAVIALTLRFNPQDTASPQTSRATQEAVAKDREPSTPPSSWGSEASNDAQSRTDELAAAILNALEADIEDFERRLSAPQLDLMKQPNDHPASVLKEEERSRVEK